MTHAPILDVDYWQPTQLANQLARIAARVQDDTPHDAATLRAAADLLRYVAHNVRVHKLERARTLPGAGGDA